jgi:ABC-type Fe3+-hydroxamate transport system substrate-binding protein
MAHILEHRRGPDRRKQPRGGRRANEGDGFAPLVLLVDEGAGAVSRSEAILAKLRFAVATSNSVEDALRVVVTLRPDLVVAADGDAERIRKEAPQHLPVIVMAPDLQDSPEALIEEIRRTLRARG